MAWKANEKVDQRKKFISEYQSGDWSMAELCRAYDISRPSGYMWVKRSQEEGEGLQDRSRAAHHHPHQVAESIEQKILQMPSSASDVGGAHAAVLPGATR